jgi:hypothetical protein
VKKPDILNKAVIAIVPDMEANNTSIGALLPGSRIRGNDPGPGVDSSWQVEV